MAVTNFDLVEIARALRQKSRLIFIVAGLSAVTAALIYLVADKDYEAKTEFFVFNPLYSDRNNVFRTDEARFIGYFSNEDDMDKVIAIANSQIVRDMIMQREHLDKVYELDVSKPKDKEKFNLRFKKNYKIKRAEYQNMELVFSNPDPKVSANVASEAVRVIEEVYRNYFNTIRLNIYNSIQSKARETDSSIASLTDTLAKLRDQYQIYDIISPARQSGGASLKSNGVASFGRGVEEIQNIEAIKDQFVKDRAEYASLLNEYSTGTKADEMPMVQVITPAEVPVKPSGLGFILTVIAGLIIGVIFTAIGILISAYYRSLSADKTSA